MVLEKRFASKWCHRRSILLVCHNLTESLHKRETSHCCRTRWEMRTICKFLCAHRTRIYSSVRSLLLENVFFCSYSLLHRTSHLKESELMDPKPFNYPTFFCWLFWIYVCFFAKRACVKIYASNFPLFSFLIWSGVWVIETVRRWIYTEEEPHFKLAHKTRLLYEDYHVWLGPF